MSRIPDLDDFLDPKTLTPQGLYRLQSDTWAQGADQERERIIKLLENRIEGCKGYECETCDEQIGLIAAKALIKGEQK
jgi:hypothetical protein